MRSIPVLLVALLFVSAPAAAEWGEAEEDLAVTVIRIEETTVHMSWSAAPGALTYHVFRGPSLDELQPLAKTPHLSFVDLEAPLDDTWYVVVTNMQVSDDVLGPMRGKCLAVRGLTGVSVTLAHCLPLGTP